MRWVRGLEKAVDPVLKDGLLWIVPGVEYPNRSAGEWVGSRRAGSGERKVSCLLRPGDVQIQEIVGSQHSHDAVAKYTS
jgi:hypothetical protein